MSTIGQILKHSWLAIFSCAQHIRNNIHNNTMWLAPMNIASLLFTKYKLWHTNTGAFDNRNYQRIQSTVFMNLLNGAQMLVVNFSTDWYQSFDYPDLDIKVMATENSDLHHINKAWYFRLLTAKILKWSKDVLVFTL